MVIHTISDFRMNLPSMFCFKFIKWQHRLSLNLLRFRFLHLDTYLLRLILPINQIVS